ncbi:MAG: cytochrome b/b6 domain-containing protein [Hydrogenophaga sp.]
MHTIRVWDLPTRLFHWALVGCVVGLIVTGNVGGNAMVWHGRLGYAVLTLLLFRVVWGLVGGHWSRFVNFLPAPMATLAYLRGRTTPVHSVGHNPLGAWSVWALLLVLLAQVGSGLFADDEIAFAGPLAGLVTGDWVGTLTRYHKGLGKLVLIALVVLHLAAIAFYELVRRQRLLRPMISGDKVLPMPAQASRDSARSRWVAALLLLACALTVYGIVSLGGGTTPAAGFD